MVVLSVVDASRVRPAATPFPGKLPYVLPVPCSAHRSAGWPQVASPTRTLGPYVSSPAFLDWQNEDIEPASCKRPAPSAAESCLRGSGTKEASWQLAAQALVPPQRPESSDECPFPTSCLPNICSPRISLGETGPRAPNAQAG